MSKSFYICFAYHNLNDLSMKNLIVIAALLVFTLCFLKTNAQSWTMQAPYPTFNNLFGVSFPTSSVGYLGGRNGTLMKTTDGGITWNDLDFYPNVDYNQFGNLNFLSVDTGFIAGGTHVYKTTDGGTTWTAHSINQWATTTGTHFINDSTGYAYGYYSLLYKTTDAGETWDMLSFTVATDNLYYNVRFANENTGYLIEYIFYPSSNTLKRTDNGGLTWYPVSVPEEVIEVSAVEVLGPDDIWISSKRPFFNGNYGTNWESRVYHTTDGGATWTTHPVGMANSSSAVDYIKFFNQQEGIVMGFAHIYSTADGGETWTDNINGEIEHSSSDFYCSWLNADTCFISGYKPSLFRSFNGGDTLENLMRDVEYNYECVYFRDSLNGYAGASLNGFEGQPIVRFTHDGGQTWNNAIMDSVNSWAINDIYFFDYLHGIALYNEGFFLTSDAGYSWTSDTTGFSLLFPVLEVTTDGTLLIAGVHGEIIRSLDNGLTWELLFEGFEEATLIDFQFTDDLTGYMAMGPHNSIYLLFKTTDGGQTWNEVGLPSTFPIKGMNFADNLHGILSMENDIILYTTDGGISWNESNTSLPCEANYIKMYNQFDAVIVNSGIYVATTQDGGANFQVIYHDETPEFTSARGTCFINPEMGWSVGESGMIEKYDANLVSTYDIELPSNYTALLIPNPSTGIVRASNTGGELIISSISGITVFTKIIKPEEEINISFLPAGIYIATIKNNKGNKSMKLIVL